MVKYIYDALDRVSEIQYNTGEGNTFETVYEYAYTAAGQLHSVIDHRSNEQHIYTYDAWGVLTVTCNVSAGTLDYSILNQYNPFRYRGYFYDTDSGLYYLQTQVRTGTTQTFIKLNGL